MQAKSPRGQHPLRVWDGGRGSLSTLGSFVRPRNESGGSYRKQGVKSSLQNLSPHFPPLRLCTAPAHAQCALELGWLGEGIGQHPHLRASAILASAQWGNGTWPPSSLTLSDFILTSHPPFLASSSCPVTSYSLTPLQAGTVHWTQGCPPWVGKKEGSQTRRIMQSLLGTCPSGPPSPNNPESREDLESK